MTTVASLVAAAAARLREAGLSPADAQQDAAVLARGVLRWSLADWLSASRQPAPATFETTFTALVDRRASREPVAYLLGEKEFYGRPFRVTAATLIPRPETEGLVEAALAWIAARPVSGTPLRALDVGTGSGCIAITLALESAGSRLQVSATDISDAALTIARGNAQHLGASVTFHQGHLLADAAVPVDLIVSNPPYVPSGDRTTMAPDVVDHEPAGALFAGDTGLDVIEALIPEARRSLASGGALMMEIGFGQAAQVESALAAADFTRVTTHADLQGIARVVVGHVL